jgi:putative endonuclease
MATGGVTLSRWHGECACLHLIRQRVRAREVPWLSFQYEVTSGDRRSNPWSPWENPPMDVTCPLPSFPRKRESRKVLMSERQPAVYILASKRNGTLYIGVTGDLRQRIWEHKNDLVEGFTEMYRVHTLVYFELHDQMTAAIRREKQLKKWNRAWKLQLIEQHNPEWTDLWQEIV